MPRQLTGTHKEAKRIKLLVVAQELRLRGKELETAPLIHD